jgi:hypothetical protein
VIAGRELASPDPGQLRACGLASAAEAGLVVLPAHLLLDLARAIEVGTSAFVVGFVPVYVAAGVVACRFRTSRSLAAAAAAIAVLAGVTLGGGGMYRTAFTVIVSLLVALRVVSLGIRDWRTPVHAELGWWATILGVEVLAAAGPVPQWRPMLLLVVPGAFACAMASRAITVWSGQPGAGDGASWVRRGLASAGALAVAMAVAVVFAARAGLLGLVGRWLRPVLEGMAALLVWLVVQAARPIFWLADRVGFDPEGMREFLERMRADALRDRSPDGLAPPGSSPGQRFLGLLIVAAIAYALYGVLRRWLSRPEPDRPPARERLAHVETAAAPERLDSPPRWRFRAELPADAVRRLYAEVLLDLRERRVVKDPWLTPAEFVPVVAAEFPLCTDDFRELTRSYENARYGNVRLGRGEVRDLEYRQRRLRSRLAKTRHGDDRRGE